MLGRPEFIWVAKRFGDYDFVYLDPLITVAVAGGRGWLLDLFARTPAAARTRLLHDLANALGATEAATSATFLQSGGVGQRFKNDRRLQIRLRELLDGRLGDVGGQYYQGTKQLLSQKNDLRAIANDQGGAALVVLDAMLGLKNSIPGEIQYAFQVPEIGQNGARRNVELVACDVPAPVISLADPAVPLVVDQHVFYNWSESLYTALASGWYPFARVIGIYCTVAGGRSYINVQALLVREYPALDDMLVPRPGELRRESLPGTLEWKQSRFLDPEIDRLEKASKAGSRPALPNPYDRDHEFLSPLLLFVLCCRLNNVSWTGLQACAPEASQTLKKYSERLTRLASLLEALGLESKIRAVEKRPQELLPEPPVDVRSGYFSP